MQSARNDNQPYIFITGAGCSVSAGIPLANKIVSELNEQFDLELKPLSAEDRRDYGKCMARIEASKRRKYLQGYIENAKINWSHIALACLIKEGYVRRVLTFNFDNLLARSCGLLGQYPPTYDFTAANLNLHRLIDDPAIVHLHGQGHGFVQLNSDAETEEHATRLKEFVGHTLSESPTLFIGYSGKSDAFLPQIEKQFSDQHRLFWVDMGDQAPEHLKNKLLTSSLAHYMSCENGSDLFLIQLAQELDCFPPTIFADPYQHLLDELDEIADYPMPKEESSEDKKENRSTLSNTSAQDILWGTKNKLKEVQQKDKEEETNFLEEYLQGNYEEIIQKLEIHHSLSSEQSLWLARSYIGLALQQSSRSEQIEIYEKLIDRFEDNNELDIQGQVAKALLSKGIALEELEQLDHAIEIYDGIVERFGQSNELILQESVAKALLYKAIMLRKREQLESAIKVFDELIDRFGENDELVLQESVARAFVSKNITFRSLKQLDNAIEACNELIKRFGESDEFVLREAVSKAFMGKALALNELGQLSKEIEVCNELIDQFGNSNELVLQEDVALALIHKAMTLNELELSDRENEVYNEIIRRFGESNEVFLQKQVAIAFNQKGYSKLLMAKKQWRNIDVAQDYLSKASNDFSKALKKSSRDNHAMILGNVAYTEFLQGNVSDSENHLRKALQQDGQPLYEATIEDTAKHTVDLDTNFKNLLEKVWNEINE